MQDRAIAAAAWLAGKRRWRWPEIAFWAFAVAAIWLFPTRHLLLAEIADLGLFALSLDMILGYAGIVSLGHAAFLGVGAYVAGLAANAGHGDPLLGLLLAALAAGVLGFATSFLVLRGSDLSRLMVTLGVCLVCGEAANEAAWLTGGADGLQGISIGPLLGRFDFDFYGTTAYVYVLATSFVLVLLARRMVHAPFGVSLRAIRDNPLRARAVGIPVNRRLVLVYTLSAVYAGIAGALLAQTTQFVSLDVFDFHRSADVLLVLIIGGTGFLYGGPIGAAVFKGFQTVLSDLSPQYSHFWLGLLLVVIVLVGRDRLRAGPLGRLVTGLRGAAATRRAEAEGGR